MTHQPSTPMTGRTLACGARQRARVGAWLTAAGMLAALSVSTPVDAAPPAAKASTAASASNPGATPEATPAATPTLTHRPLRDNQPPPPLNPTEPEVFTGYAAAPVFTVVPRKPHLELFPCSQCHKLLPLNAKPRKLEAAPHVDALDHGKGRMWCLDCHLGTDRDSLRTLGGTKVDFDQAYLVCGQCHSARQKDWYFGAHGKRAANWKGPREIYSCTHCHDPHSPSLKPRAPQKPPPLRAGLTPMKIVREDVPLPWQHRPKGQP